MAEISVNVNEGDSIVQVTLENESPVISVQIIGSGPAGPQGAQGPAGQDGADGSDGADGQDGDDGTTFTPAVSSAGVLSWTNDGGKQNPASVDLVAAVLSALPTWTGGNY